LGRPWIHEAGAVPSTLHQNLKFVKNGKVVTVKGEQALLVSQLSSSTTIEVDDADGLNFQGLSLDDKNDKKKETVMSSLKDAQE
ncbi:receptor-like kinase, partial [Trifolium medium]|nr:receptor-like kinase [Trifolium medium]